MPGRQLETPSDHPPGRGGLPGLPPAPGHPFRGPGGGRDLLPDPGAAPVHAAPGPARRAHRAVRPGLRREPGRTGDADPRPVPGPRPRDRFVWLRGFPDIDHRARGLGGRSTGGRSGRSTVRPANATMLDCDERAAAAPGARGRLAGFSLAWLKRPGARIRGPTSRRASWSPPSITSTRPPERRRSCSSSSATSQPALGETPAPASSGRSRDREQPPTRSRPFRFARASTCSWSSSASRIWRPTSGTSPELARSSRSAETAHAALSSSAPPRSARPRRLRLSPTARSLLGR